MIIIMVKEIGWMDGDNNEIEFKRQLQRFDFPY